MPEVDYSLQRYWRSRKCLLLSVNPTTCWSEPWRLTEDLCPQTVRHEFLHSPECHLSEAAASSHDDPRRDNLTDTLGIRSNKGANGSNCRRRKEEVTPAEDVRETASD